MNQLEQLKQYTTVVADTGDFQSIAAFTPQDATTNPSLILKAVQQNTYQPLLDKVARDYHHLSVTEIIDHLLVAFGVEILNIIPGRVSTEVDARLSFDRQGTVDQAHRIIQYYEDAGIDRERVLIKIAATWEGIAAAKLLQKAGIHCNLTLVFSMTQAMVCAEANTKLISPFVGRISDWYSKHTGQTYTAQNDPGVISVKNIYTYFHQFGYETEIMGASFRNIEQIIALAGCDLLTINPKLLSELAASNATIQPQLSADIQNPQLQKMELNEKQFRLLLNEDAMATEKLAEGIRIFCHDMSELEKMVLSHLQNGTTS